MAPGVTVRIWKVSDLVDLWEAEERGGEKERRKKMHNPYRYKLKLFLTAHSEGSPSDEICCRYCGRREKDGYAINIGHILDNGAQDRRLGTGNHYYKRLLDRVKDEVSSGKPLSLELVCLEHQGNPKRTDKAT